MSNFYKFLEELKELNLPDKEYAIFGSGPLAIRGMREPEDLDIIVTKELYEKLKERYPEKDRGIFINNIEIISPDASIVENPEEIIKRAELIKGFRFTLLKDIIAWKKNMKRPKDINDIKLIENYFKKV